MVAIRTARNDKFRGIDNSTLVLIILYIMDDIIRCQKCDSGVKFLQNMASCQCGETVFSKSRDVYFRDTFSTDSCNEMVTRDRQATGYLRHEKFPTQISSFKQWLNKLAIGLEGVSCESENWIHRKRKLLLI